MGPTVDEVINIFPLAIRLRINDGRPQDNHICVPRRSFRHWIYVLGYARKHPD